MNNINLLIAKFASQENFEFQYLIKDNTPENLIPLINKKISDMLNNSSYALPINTVFDGYKKFIYINEFVENFTNQLSVVELNNLNSYYNYLINIYDNKSYFSPTQIHKLEKHFFKSLIKTLDSFDNNSDKDDFLKKITINSFFNSNENGIFNKNILYRIIFNHDPTYLNTMHKKERINLNPINSPDKLIKHTDILYILYNKDKSKFTYKFLKDIIKLCSPAAKQILRRVLFANKNKLFALDEILMPINENYELVSINDNDLIVLITNPICSYFPKTCQNWKQFFFDFKIIPMFDYFASFSNY